tara:strand:+ start:222 stop:524 length:303 start_codon:yes stop_codon:yes gene_type:complete
MIYFHGTNNPAAVIAAIDNGTLSLPFHLTPSTVVANNYGHTVLAIEFDEDFKRVMPRMINKAGSYRGNYNRNVGNGIELVIENHVQLGEFYMNALEAVIH